MRIVLFCATQRGYRFLERLAQLAAGHQLAVFTFREQPHEPAYFDDLRALAGQVGADFYEATQVGADKWRPYWESTPVDLMFAVSWRYLIPPTVYRRATLGAYVFHDSLLPRYRGFAPTVWAILNGETHTGATLFEMADAVDSGPIIGQRPVAIGPDDTIADVLPRVTEAYLDLLTEYLPALLAATATRREQDPSHATYTCRRLPEDNRIDWSRSAEAIYNLIRATTRPYPGAFTTLKGQRLTLWSAKRLAEAPVYVGRVPGRVAEIRPGEGVVVLTGDGVLLVTRVQLDGETEVPADTVLTSLSMTLGR